jgi:hypothetical protein
MIVIPFPLGTQPADLRILPTASPQMMFWGRQPLLASAHWHKSRMSLFYFTLASFSAFWTSHFGVEGAFRRLLCPVWTLLAYCCEGDPTGLSLLARVPLSWLLVASTFLACKASSNGAPPQYTRLHLPWACTLLQ